MPNTEKDKGEDTRILWAPWRIEYITDTAKNEGCIFCEKSAEQDDRTNLIVHRGKTAFVIMNRYPYNNGHLLIVPNRHTAEMASLSDEEKIELINLLQYAQEVLEEVMKPQGFNIGMNLGRLAGAGITDHLHFHVVPRWGGDTNFMPIIGSTKVISEALSDTYKKIKNALENI